MLRGWGPPKLHTALKADFKRIYRAIERREQKRAKIDAAFEERRTVDEQVLASGGSDQPHKRRARR
jgi:hypothetical protein